MIMDLDSLPSGKPIKLLQKKDTTKQMSPNAPSAAASISAAINSPLKKIKLSFKKKGSAVTAPSSALSTPVTASSFSSTSNNNNNNNNNRSILSRRDSTRNDVSAAVSMSEFDFPDIDQIVSESLRSDNNTSPLPNDTMDLDSMNSPASKSQQGDVGGSLGSGKLKLVINTSTGKIKRSNSTTNLNSTPGSARIPPYIMHSELPQLHPQAPAYQFNGSVKVSFFFCHRIAPFLNMLCHSPF
jgi:hypothetical protein